MRSRESILPLGKGAVCSPHLLTAGLAAWIGFCHPLLIRVSLLVSHDVSLHPVNGCFRTECLREEIPRKSMENFLLMATLDLPRHRLELRGGPFPLTVITQMAVLCPAHANFLRHSPVSTCLFLPHISLFKRGNRGPEKGAAGPVTASEFKQEPGWGAL